jgi:hypothetical protein
MIWRSARRRIDIFVSASGRAPPPEPVYSYLPCPPSPGPPPPGSAPPPAAPGGANGNQCLAATVPYPPYQYYVAPSYYPYASPYYPGGVSFGFGVIR